MPVLEAVADLFRSKKSAERQAQAAERARLQEQLNREPELRAEQKELATKHAATTAKVNAGTLTRAALHHVEHLQDSVGHRLGECSKIRGRLIDTCPDELLQASWRRLKARKRPMSESRDNAKHAVDAMTLDIAAVEKQLTQHVEDFKYARDENAVAAFEQQEAYRDRIGKMRDELADLRRDAETVQIEFDRFTAQLEEHRQKMVEA